MKLTHAWVTLALALAPIGLGGCVAAAAGAAAGAGAVAYAKGDLNATVDAPMDQTWQATVDAAHQLGLGVQKEQSDAFNGQLVASQTKGGDVKIHVSRGDTPDTTKVDIRVGTFGDEQKSLQVLKQIRQNLAQQERQPAQQRPG